MINAGVRLDAVNYNTKIWANPDLTYTPNEPRYYVDWGMDGLEWVDGNNDCVGNSNPYNNPECWLDSDGNPDQYFDENGKNVKKALLKTPLDGARLSSSFGMRKHPISGYNKLHKGVDFAAPIGTPIYAGGNGVIEFVGRNGGYGKYIRIRHNNSYKTAYAHLNNYKKGIYKGLRVNQGEVIGYVGSTGKSTGPHLHYEIILDGKQINPMSLKLPPQKILKNDELKRFIKESDMIYANFLYNLFE